MSKAFHLVHWDTLYETAETRKIRSLTYYSKPNKLVGEGIGFTLGQPDHKGPFLLGMFALLECLASTAPQGLRGWLIRNGTGLTPARMASLTHVREEFFAEALEFFQRPEIAWIEHKAIPGTTSGDSPGDGREDAGTPPGQSPGKKPDAPNGREDAGTISPRGKTDRRGKTEGTREREENGGFGDPEAARVAQRTQFAALNARVKQLEGIPEDERDEIERADLKKTRADLRALQRKQAHGDFTPLVHT